MVDHRDVRIFQPLFVAFLVLPAALLILLAFGEEWVWPEILPVRWSYENWERSFSGDRGLMTGLGNSLLLAFLVSITATFFGFMTSRSIAYSKHSSRWLLAAYSPYVISPILYAIWIHIFFVRGDLAGSIGGVLAGQFLLAYPYSVIFFQGFWNKKIQSFEDLGKTMGCSPGFIRRKIVWPMAAGMVTVCLFQCFLISWFEFGLTSLIGVGQIKTLPVLVYTFVQEANIHLASIASIMLVLPVMTISLFRKKWILKNK